MWKCKNCGEEVEDNFEICWNCSSNKDGTKTSKTDEYQIQPIREPIENQKENDGSFWSFDKMISGALIKILYWLGVIGIIITGAFMFQNDDTILLVGLIIVGNLIWRIVCEGIIVIFKIFEKLNQIERKL